MCVRNLRPLLIFIAYRVLFYKGRDHLVTRRILRGIRLQAVSGSLCLCVCAQPTFIADLRNCFIRGVSICLHQFVKDDQYRKEIRGIRLIIQGNKQEY